MKTRKSDGEFYARFEKKPEKKVTSKYFGAAIATLEADIVYYKANRESDPECHDARVKELEEAIEVLRGAEPVTSST